MAVFTLKLLSIMHVMFFENSLLQMSGTQDISSLHKFRSHRIYGKRRELRNNLMKFSHISMNKLRPSIINDSS